EIPERYSVLPAYSLLQIASLLRQEGHDVFLVDTNGENIYYSQFSSRLEGLAYQALIFRFTPPTFDWDMETAKLSKGLHSQAMTVSICWTLRTMPKVVPDEAHELDIYLRHEYEVVAVQLIDAMAREEDDLAKIPRIAYRDGGKIHVNSDAEPVEDYDSLHLLAYDLLPGLRNYFIDNHEGEPSIIIYSSKGCPYGCIFCTVAKTKWKKRGTTSILQELEYLKESYNIK
ncbi:B12-binding domain-containing radical SAM protein, partial [Chloroflexota bacterium]